MTKNIEENRKQWPKEHDDFKVGSKTVDSKKVWEKESDYKDGGQYSKIQTWTFRSGHSIEVDNTEGGERLRMSHSKGSYVEMQHDGSVIYRANNDSYEVIAGDQNIRVKGTTHIEVSGDANIKVVGNADLEIGGNFNGTVGGDWIMKASNIIFKMGLMRFEGARVEHDGINIGKDHVHQDVEPGPGVSGVPLP